MVLRSIFDFISRIIDAFLSMLGLSASSASALPPNALRVFIKYSGKTIQVDLDPSWSVAQIKAIVAPKLGCAPEEIKIIFAGNELPDNFILQSCDVGQQSYLHAVRVHIRQPGNTGEQSQEDLEIVEKKDDNNTEGTSDEGASVAEANPGPSCPLADRTRTFSKNMSEDDASNTVVIDGEPDLECSIMEEDEQEWVKVNSNSGKAGQTKSDFFVFCNDSECGDLREGKLRVRCAKCLSGAFTVLRHPQEWKDVLVPSQVEGSCEEGCEVAFAQFYFKCSSHVTKGEDDSSPPLPQVKRNSEGVPCLACGDVKELVFLFPCPKSHVTCIECFKDYTLTKLSHREFTQDESVGYTLGCPALCDNSLIKDPHHFKLIGKTQYDRYQRFGTEECLLQMGGIFCPQPDCGMGIIPADSNCDKIACLHGCGYVFCKRCLEGWHIGPCRQDGNSAPVEDCSTGGYRSTGYYVSEDRAAAAQWGDATRRAMRLSTKPCPNCRVPTERDGGCMHMECTKCKFQWCWVCQTKWTRECMGNHWFG